MFKIVLVSMLIVGMVFAECDDDQVECDDGKCCPKGYVIGIFFYFANQFYRNPLNNGAALLLAVAYNAGALDYVLQQLTISAGGDAP